MEHVPLRILEVRLIVAFLGEKDQFGWWDTAFLSTTGQSFLEHCHPRTKLLAGLNGACQAAQRIHDQRIGVGDVFHLFRLPFTIEQSLFQVAQVELTGMIDCIATQEDGLSALSRIAGSKIKVSPGPEQIAVESKLLRESTVEEFALHYLSAFEQGIQAYPYATAAQIEETA